MKIVCIIQARISSSRLPAKILLPGYNKPLLFHLIDRINKCKKINQVVVATSQNPLDDLLHDLCLSKKIKVFRGSLNDLLERYFKCAKKFKADHIASASDVFAVMATIGGEKLGGSANSLDPNTFWKAYID